MLGHLQVHRKGYIASIDNLPLNLNMQPPVLAKVEEALKAMPDVAAYSPRVKFGAMFSNFTETTSIRLNGIDPKREDATVPAAAPASSKAPRTASWRKGEVLIPTCWRAA
jgi:putative ABC transport system permease protein